MYALIFWTGVKKTSIVKIADLQPDKAEGEVTSVKWEQKYYKARIIRKSGK